MLVLTRKIREGIVITPPGCADITITVNRLTGNTVQLGIEAPKDMNIIRQELDADSKPPISVETEKVS